MSDYWLGFFHAMAVAGAAGGVGGAVALLASAWRRGRRIPARAEIATSLDDAAPQGPRREPRSRFDEFTGLVTADERLQAAIAAECDADARRQLLGGVE